MSILTRYLSGWQAAEVAETLRELGFGVTAADCTEFASNVIQHVAGADPDAREMVQQVIADVLGMKTDPESTIRYGFEVR